jgi:hypothetical protein
VAVNCRVEPTATEAGFGLTVMDCSTGAGAAVTVRGDGLLTTPPDLAVMLGLPTATPVANPLTLMAAAVEEELQVTAEVRGWVLLLL